MDKSITKKSVPKWAWWVIALPWALTLLAVSVWQSNINPTAAAVLWVAGIVVWAFSFRGDIVIPYDWSQWWRIFPGPLLIFATLGTFLVGPVAGEGYVTLGTGDNLRASPSQRINVLWPWEPVVWWDVKQEVWSGTAAGTTVDGNKVEAQVTFSVSLEQTSLAALDLTRTYGNPFGYQSALKEVANAAFSNAVAELKLSGIQPSSLLLEAAVVEAIGEVPHTHLLGPVVISEIHVTSGNGAP